MQKPSIELMVMKLYFLPREYVSQHRWRQHFRRELEKEVKEENRRYYGLLHYPEAQNPGLDYDTKAHRRRLGQFPHHRHLFEIMDYLRLTYPEILTLCDWKGTITYEMRNGTRVRDTTWDDIEVCERMPTYVSEFEGCKRLLPFVSRPRPNLFGPSLRGGFIEMPYRSLSNMNDFVDDHGDVDNSEGEELSPEVLKASEDETPESIGIDLNRRLSAAIEARARGEEEVLDSDWEQWLKESAERRGQQATTPRTLHVHEGMIPVTLHLAP